MLRSALLPVLLMALAHEVSLAQSPGTGFIDGSVTVEGTRFPYQVYVPSSYHEAAAPLPVILFLHGSGERGTDGLRPTVAGLAPAIRNDPKRFPAIVVFPQSPPDSSWRGRPARAAVAALDAVLATYRTDPDRVYLTGLSMGGNGTWYVAYRHPERFAAVVPICGWVSASARVAGGDPVIPAEDGDPFEALTRRLQNVPIWIFHGELDPAVPVQESRLAAEALRAADAPVRYTEFLGTGHNSWDPAYASVSFTDWLFAQRRTR